MCIRDSVWTKAFWRPRADAPEGGLTNSTASALVLEGEDVELEEREDVGRMPVTLVLPTAALIAVGLALTVWAGPIFNFTDDSADNLIREPGTCGAYIDAVLGCSE